MKKVSYFHSIVKPSKNLQNLCKCHIFQEKAKDFAAKFPDKKILYLTMTTLNLHSESLLADGPEFDIEEYKKRLNVMEFMATIDFVDYQNIEVMIFMI